MYDVEVAHIRCGVQSYKWVQEEIRQVSEGSVDVLVHVGPPPASSPSQWLSEGGGILGLGALCGCPTYFWSPFRKYVSYGCQRQGTELISMDILLLKELSKKDNIFGF